MFVLSTIADLIQIKPHELRKPTEEALEDNINEKYANKVLQNVGLCICLWDVLRASEGLIGQGDGIINVNVEFRLIVFRPFKGEIIQGVILESKPDGIRISLDFFADVWIPAPHNLPPGSRFQPASSDTDPAVWIWNPSFPDPPEGEEFWYDRLEVVRFRVESEEWHDATPHQKPDLHAKKQEELGVMKKTGKEAEEEEERRRIRERPVPYTILGSMGHAGLGIVSWWRGGVEEEEMAVDAE